MKILAIESSCDETAAAVIEDGRKICSNVIDSQVETHALYGGVVPEIASRGHMEAVVRVTEQALHEAGISKEESGRCCGNLCARGLLVRYWWEQILENPLRLRWASPSFRCTTFAAYCRSIFAVSGAEAAVFDLGGIGRTFDDCSGAGLYRV